MEYKDPMIELLSSLEQIVFKDNQVVSVSQKPSAFLEFEHLRESIGLKTDDFAQVMGVSVTMVQEWESRRLKPSITELKLMRLIQAHPGLSQQLIR